MASPIPPSEAANPLTFNLDTLSPVEFVRTLRGVDSQLFAGWAMHSGLLDDRLLAAAEATVLASKTALASTSGAVVLTGCGTSGRIAYLTARRFQRLSKLSSTFTYLISGGDPAILLSDELPEDDPIAGAAQLAGAAELCDRVSLIGISCGLSAPYVAGQLDYAMCAPTLEQHGIGAGDGGAGFATSVLGFNPHRLARNNPIEGLRSAGLCSFRDVVAEMEARAGSPWCSVLDPVVGAEAIAGSSRMKGGSATLALTDAICFRALRLVGGLAHDMEAADSSSFSIATLLRAAQRAVSETYHQPAALAAVAALAGRAMRAEGGRILYIGDGVAAIIGMIDASEMPDTYGVPFDTVRAFVKNGWSAMENRDGDISSTSPLLQLSVHAFERDVLPTITSADAVILLGCGCEPGTAEGGDADHANDATPQPWLWELVPLLRAQVRQIYSFVLLPILMFAHYSFVCIPICARSLRALGV